MQMTAEEQLDTLSLSYSLLRRHDMVFVLSKSRLSFFRPFCAEPVVIKTYPKAEKGILFFREYEIFSPSGERIAIATTEWALMEFSTRKILRPGALPKPIPVDPSPLENFSTIRRFSLPPLTTLTTLTVEEKHLDKNNHVNNAVYGDFVTACLGDENIKGIEIHYLAEAVLGDTLRLDVGDEYVRGTLSNHKICFEARLLKGFGQ